MKNRNADLFSDLRLLGITIVILMWLTSCVAEQTMTVKPLTPDVSTTNVPVSTATETLQVNYMLTPEIITTPTAHPPMPTTFLSPTPLSLPAPVSSFSILPVEQRCNVESTENSAEAELAMGLILFGNWEDGSTNAILGSNGLNDPLFFLPTDGYFFDTSPNQKALAYYTLEKNDDLSSLEVTILDTTLMTPLIQNRFETIEFAPTAQTNWANENHLTIALTNQDELYRWLVWYPFEGREEVVAVELEGIGDALERYHTSVSYDPFLELVIYPCQDCSPDEYRVKDINTGNTLWSIDLGPNPDDAYRGFPYWSSDGQYVAISGHQWGEDNAVWVFNREGEELYKLQGGGLTMRWSPDNRYLVFTHKNLTNEATISSTFTLLDVVDKRLLDLCVEPSGGVPYWSPDSTKIAFTSDVSEVDNPETLLNIVDIYSGNLIQLLSEDEKYRPEGWVDISQDGS